MKESLGEFVMLLHWYCVMPTLGRMLVTVCWHACVPLVSRLNPRPPPVLNFIVLTFFCELTAHHNLAPIFRED